MRIRGVGRLQAIGRRVRNRVSPGTVILLYHRVASLPTDPQLLAVSPQHFAQHLEVLRSAFVPASLTNLSESLNKGTVPRRGVVITFDDGAADNLHNAKPLLEQHDVPAVVFVATGFTGTVKEFWWDDLERCLLLPGRRPQALTLSIGTRRFEWDLGNAADYTPSQFELLHRWHTNSSNGAGIRQKIYTEIYDLIRTLLPGERQSVINQLHDWSGTQSDHRAEMLGLSAAEITKLASGGIVEIGAHTVNHPVLAAISPEEQQREISESKRRLEEILNQPVKHFAYPYGTRSDYSATTVSLVKRAAFETACANFTGVVQPGVPRYELPRFVVRDWDGDEFRKQVERWFVSD